VKITTRSYKSVKRTLDLNAKCDHVLLASTKPPTKSLRSDHRTTTGEPGPLGRRGGREARAAIEAAGAGALHPFVPSSETECAVASR
jgi:hypothetical protein